MTAFRKFKVPSKNADSLLEGLKDLGWTHEFELKAYVEDGETQYDSGFTYKLFVGDNHITIIAPMIMLDNIKVRELMLEYLI